MQYLIPILFCISLVILMGVALHFSQYKKRTSGCCGGVHCNDVKKESAETHTCAKG